ncbi:DedA family protein [Brachybacterium endophyticum]|uniref:DedA family protein n=1 Tax=Brachybacterium endophyticum TaxID=2182385 RepID=UPI001F0B98B5|nr:VTT domain-containing protein [Brachybacterium endophyticum]
MLVSAVAVAASAGSLPTMLLLVAVAALGAMIGDNIAFAIGGRLGALRGRWLRGPRLTASIDRAQQGLERRGASFLLTARFIPVGRVAVNLAAGAVGFPWRRFLRISALSGVIWASYNAVMGVLAGQWLADQPLLSAVIGTGVALALGLVVDRIASRRRASGESTPVARPNPPRRGPASSRRLAGGRHLRSGAWRGGTPAAVAFVGPWGRLTA